MKRFSQLFFDFTLGREEKPPAPPPEARPPAHPVAPEVTGAEPAAEANRREAPRDAAPATAGADAKLTALVRQWCQELDMPDLAAKVSVHWNGRLRTTAGTASPRTAAIDLNCKLNTFGSDVVLRIVKHELAHLVAHRRAGRRKIAAHGLEWRQACADLGIAGEKSRHTLPLPATRQRRKYAYQCPACSDVVLRVRKLARYSACWRCCKAHNRGEYARRFQFVEIPLDKGLLLASLQNHLNGNADAE